MSVSERTIGREVACPKCHVRFVVRADSDEGLPDASSERQHRDVSATLDAPKILQSPDTQTISFSTPSTAPVQQLPSVETPTSRPKWRMRARALGIACMVVALVAYVASQFWASGARLSRAPLLDPNLADKGQAGASLGVGAADQSPVKGQSSGSDSVSEDEAVRRVVREVVEFPPDGDPDVLLGYFTPAARKQLSVPSDQALRPLSMALSPGMTTMINEVVVTGKEAVADCVVREAGLERPLSLLLRQEDGWKIYGMKLPLDTGSSGEALAVNFESPQESAENLMSSVLGLDKNDLEEMGQAFGSSISNSMEEATGPTPASAQDRFAESLKSMSVAEFNHSWQTSLHVNEQPAIAVLDKICSEMGFALTTTPEQQEVVSTLISVHREGISHWQLLEEVANQVGLYPVWDRDGWMGAQFASSMFGGGADKSLERPRPAIELKSLPRTAPMQFAGPFVIHIEELTAYPPHPVGKLSLAYYSNGLPEAVLRLAERRGGLLQNAVVKGPQGQRLNSPQSTSGSPMLDVVGASHSGQKILELTNLLRSVDRLSEVHVQVKFPIPIEVQKGSLDDVEAGKSASVGMYEVKIDEYQLRSYQGSGAAETSLKLTSTAPKNEPLWLAFYGADGQLLHVESYFSSGDEQASEYQYEVVGEVKSLEVKLVSQLDIIEHDILFRDVPLPQAAELPEQIAELTFSGDSPVTLEFLQFVTGRFRDREAEVRITNNSSKPITGMFLDVVYFDESGQKVQEATTSAFAHHQPTNGVQVLVEPGGQHVAQLHLPFLTDQAVSVQFQPRTVNFSDATAWQPKR